MVRRAALTGVNQTCDNVSMQYAANVGSESLSEIYVQRDSSRYQTLGFGRSVSQKAVWANKQNTLTNANGDIIIKTKTVSLSGIHNYITQCATKKGGVDRNYYDANGKQIKHDYALDKNNTLQHLSARELTEDERRENADILC